MRRAQLVGIGVTICAVVTAPLEAPAAPASADEAAADPAASASDDRITRAENLYDKGAAKFETADYTAAVELWTEAYEIVPDAPESARIKALLIYNIATARERAFDVTRDVAQLRQAKILLERFAAELPELYAQGELAAERAKVDGKLAELSDRIAKAEGGDDAGEGPEPGLDPEPTPPPADDGPAPGRPLVIGGAVLLGVGAIGLAMMGAGLGVGAGANDLGDLDDDDIEGRRSQFSRGRLGNGLAYGGGIAGGVLVVTGAVLLGLGLRKNARAPAASAWLGDGSGGLVLTGRF